MMDRERDFKNVRIKSTAELLHSYFQLVDDWALSFEEQKSLLGERAWLLLSRQIDANADVMVDDITISRLVLLTTIHKKITGLLSNTSVATFVRTNVDDLGGRTPLNRILEDPDNGLVEVNKHLMLIAMRAADPVVV